MDAIVLAGGIPTKKDPLYEKAAGAQKSMLSIAGKPMVQWVLDALSGSQLTDTVVVIGVDNNDNLSCTKELVFLPDKGSLIENIQLGCAYLAKIHPMESHTLSISADIPAITSEIIDSCISTYQQLKVDVCYSVLERKVIEDRYPNSRRTYLKFKDVEVCGGDLNCLNKTAALNPSGVWQQLIQNRKKPLRQAALIGWGTLARLLLRQLTLDSAIEAVCRRVGITGKALLQPYAEIGMDVDKPFQFEMVEKDLLK
jgi:GTP:adenosylcobinamide-phosphate guanylyltransferase